MFGRTLARAPCSNAGLVADAIVVLVEVASPPPPAAAAVDTAALVRSVGSSLYTTPAPPGPRRPPA